MERSGKKTAVFRIMALGLVFLFFLLLEWVLRLGNLGNDLHLFVDQGIVIAG